MSDFDCLDCGVNTSAIGEYPYTLKDAVWLAVAGAKDAGMLCVSCCELRLGRRLRPRDFEVGVHCNRRRGAADRSATLNARLAT